jgi:hypothetical protein
LKQTIYQKKDGVVTRTVAGETILVPVYGDLADIRKIFSVNPVAGFIWENIDGSTSFDYLLEKMTGEYDVDRETADRDLTDLIESLKTWGLIEEV